MPTLSPTLFESVGLPEPKNLDNSGMAFYGASFGLVAEADNGNYSQNQDVGQDSIGMPTSNEAFILRDRAGYAPIKGTFRNDVLAGDWSFASVNYQELENVTSESDGFDRNIIIKNQYTKNNAWGE